MTAMAHYHVVKEKSRHTEEEEKKKRGRKKDPATKLGIFYLPFLYDPVTSQDKA